MNIAEALVYIVAIIAQLILAVIVIIVGLIVAAVIMLVIALDEIWSSIKELWRRLRGNR